MNFLEFSRIECSSTCRKKFRITSNKVAFISFALPRESLEENSFSCTISKSTDGLNATLIINDRKHWYLAFGAFYHHPSLQATSNFKVLLLVVWRESVLWGKVRENLILLISFMKSSFWQRKKGGKFSVFLRKEFLNFMSTWELTLNTKVICKVLPKRTKKLLQK